MENKNTSRVVIGVLVVLVLLLGGYIAVSGGKAAATANGASEAAALPMETYQAQNVKPETPIARSKNVTLPGWGGFTIPAKTKKITQGFEFHNPAENLWYEDWVSLDGTTLEKLADYALTLDEVSDHNSGRQEYLEAVVNSGMFSLKRTTHTTHSTAP